MCARTRMRVDVHVHTRTRSARFHEPRAHAICLTLSPQRPHQNNSGTIDKDEIKKLLEGMGHKPGAGDIEEAEQSINQVSSDATKCEQIMAPLHPPTPPRVHSET